MSASLDRLKETHDVTIKWQAYELRPAGAPPISPEYRAAIEARRPEMEAMARKHFGVEVFNPGPFGINSRPALVGAKYAEAMGHGEAYNAAMLVAYWRDGRDISQPDVMREVAESVGLDGDAYMAALDEPRYEEAVNFDVQTANDIGISGVPALLFNQKYLVGGAQTYNALVDILRQIEDMGG